MELVDFYRALLPAHGSYCLWYKGNKKHEWADSLEELAELTLGRADQRDWYYATASFSAHERKQTFVQGKRCLYLDLDAGPDKFASDPEGAYETNKHAQLAVREFVTASRLLPSMVVHSGAGLHLYYVLDEDVTEKQWKVLAKGLGRLAAKHGLKADPACTTDSARLLRPIGSLHHSGARVRLLQNTGVVHQVSLLTRFLDTPQESELGARPERREVMDVNSTLSDWEPAPTSGVKVAKHCNALREIAQVKGNVPEPQWRAMLGLVRFTVEGLALAHEWSSGHPSYDPGETEEKFDGWHGTGPTTCETFERYSKGCASCEHRGKITSPISLGRMNVKEVDALPEDKRPAPAAAPPIPDELPFEDVDFGQGFRPSFDKDRKKWVLTGKRVIETTDAEGDTVKNERWEPISNEVFWIDGWSEAGVEEGDDSAAVLHMYQNSSCTVRRWPMPARVLSTPRTLFEWLASKQITRTAVNNTVSSLMHNYVNGQFNLAKEDKAQLAIRNRFGVQYESDAADSELIVAQGRYVIRKDMTIEEAVLGPKLITRRNVMVIRPLPFSSSGKWGRKDWTDYIIPGAKKQRDFYRRYYEVPHYEPAQLAVMLGLSSPLMVFAADTQFLPSSQLPQVGLTVSLYSHSSGKGKTALLRSVASAYGDPSQLVLAGSEQDATKAFQAGVAAIQGTMPLFLDEVTQNTAADTALLINRIAQGNDRHRAMREGDPRSTKTWALIGLVTTNLPLRELLLAASTGTEALQMRVMEIDCERFPDRSKGEHIEFERRRDEMLVPYYGCLGAVLGLAIVHAGADKVRNKVVDAFDEASRIISGATQRERFFQRGMACVLTCHDLLSELKMELFDRNVLVSEYSKAAGAASDYVTFTKRSPDDLLRKMISDMSPHIIVTANDGTNGRLEIVRNTSQLRPPYVGRRIESTGTLFLLGDAVRKWAQENQVSAQEIINGAKANGFTRPVPGSTQRYTLTRGTDLSTVHGTVIALDESKLLGEVHTPARSNVVSFPDGSSSAA